MSTYNFGTVKLQGVGSLNTIAANEVNPTEDRFLFWDASANQGSRMKTLMVNQLADLIGSVAAPVSSVNGFTGVVNLTAANVGASPEVHTHTITNITGLQSALDGKANTSHAHTITNITGLQSALDGKQAISPRLQEIVDGFAAAAALAGIRKKSDGSGVEWATIAAGGNDPTQSTKVEVGSHFLTDVGGLEFQQTDTGYFTYTQQVGRPGIIRCSTGGGTGARSGYRVGSASFLFGTGKPATLKAMVRLPALSTVSDGFTAIVGFLATHTGESQNLIVLRYTHDEAGGNWVFATRQGWIESTINCGVAPVADTWQLIEIQVLGDASQAIARINGSQVAVSATNIPNAASSQFISAGFGLWKRSGVLDLRLDLDYFYASQDL